MALIKYGAVIVDSRGSVGGVTFKATRAGSVMQTKNNPLQKRTAKTTQQRNAIAELGRQWYATLSEEQRQAWRDLAAANPVPNHWGDLFPLSGIAYYLKANITLQAVGSSELTDAPLDATVTALATLSLNVTAPNTAEITFTPTPTTTNHRLLVAAAPMASPGRTPETMTYFFLQHGGDGETSPLNIATALATLTGAFHAAMRYSVKAVQVNTTNGERSSELFATTLAT